MKLSILIPSIPERKTQLLKLLDTLYMQALSLYRQHATLGTIEILVDDSKKFLEGGLSIGEKRNALLQRASGEYLCFLDDDDEVTPNYIEQLMRMCDSGMDIITFRCLIKNDYYWALADMWCGNKTNEEVNPNSVIKRTPWHICPVKSSIAKQEQFSSMNHNEDWDWMQRVLTRVKSEAHTDMILTQYNHSEQMSEADKILAQPFEPVQNSNSLIISLAIDGRDKYTQKSINLEKSLAGNWKGDVRLYKSYPHYCTPHSVIPFKFKFDLIKKAREDGYKKVFWLDSSIRIAQGKDLHELIQESGIMAFDNLGHPLYKYISDSAVEKVGVSENDLQNIPQTWGGALCFDFSKDKACSIFEEIMQHTLDGSFENSGSTRPGFVAHRHDQAVISCVLWKFGVPLLPYGKIAIAQHTREPFPFGKDFYLIYGD